MCLESPSSYLGLLFQISAWTAKISRAKTQQLIFFQLRTLSTISFGENNWKITDNGQTKPRYLFYLILAERSYTIKYHPWQWPCRAYKRFILSFLMQYVSYSYNYNLSYFCSFENVHFYATLFPRATLLTGVNADPLFTGGFKKSIRLFVEVCKITKCRLFSPLEALPWKKAFQFWCADAACPLTASSLKVLVLCSVSETPSRLINLFITSNN